MTGWGWWWGGCCSKANKEFTWKNIHVPDKNQSKTTYQKKKKNQSKTKFHSHSRVWRSCIQAVASWTGILCQ